MSQGRMVDYHYPPDVQLSLVYVTDTEAEAIRARDNREEPLVRLMAYPFGQRVFVVYAGETPSHLDEYSELKERAEHQVQSLDDLDRIIAIRLLRLLNIVRKRSQTTVSAFKDIELDAVGDATGHIDWNDDLPVVAGQLMSNLILRHPLPNANHRTGIAMLQLCIEAIAEAFPMPRTRVTDAEWQPWVNTYITESKRYLTVRRNSARFATLAELGGDVVRRKGGIEIALDRFELNMGIHEAWEYYAQLHEDLCIEFAEEVISRAIGNDYQDVSGPTKDTFVRYLADDVTDDDIGRIF